MNAQRLLRGIRVARSHAVDLRGVVALRLGEEVPGRGLQVGPQRMDAGREEVVRLDESGIAGVLEEGPVKGVVLVGEAGLAPSRHARLHPLEAGA